MPRKFAPYDPRSLYAHTGQEKGGKGGRALVAADGQFLSMGFR